MHVNFTYTHISTHTQTYVERICLWKLVYDVSSHWAFRTHPDSRTSSDVTARVRIGARSRDRAGSRPLVLCRVLKPVICHDILSCIPIFGHTVEPDSSLSDAAVRILGHLLVSQAPTSGPERAGPEYAASSSLLKTKRYWSIGSWHRWLGQGDCAWIFARRSGGRQLTSA